MIAPMKNSKLYRQDNIKEMLNWSLDKKISHALKRIKEFHTTQNGKVYISFSGGKDSTVLQHLVRSIYPSTVSVFSNTTNEFVEILDFVKHTDNVITVYPKLSFNETVTKYGFPLVSKRTARAITDLRENKQTTSNVRNLYLTGLNRKGEHCPSYKLAKKWYPLFEKATFNITNKCCDVLKKEPLVEYEEMTGLKGFVGTQVGESNQRKSNWLDYGCNIFDAKRPTSRPLSIWTEQDIWDYIHRFSIPYCEIYDDVVDKNTGEVLIEGEKRTGCAYCAFGAHLEKSNLTHKNRFERLKLRKPKQFKKIMSLKNNGVTFSEALSFIKVNH